LYLRTVLSNDFQEGTKPKPEQTASAEAAIALEKQQQHR